MSFASLLIAFAHDSQFFIDEFTPAARERNMWIYHNYHRWTLSCIVCGVHADFNSRSSLDRLRSAWIRRNVEVVRIHAAEIEVTKETIYLYVQFSFVQWLRLFSLLNRTPFDENTMGGFSGILLTELIFWFSYISTAVLITTLYLVVGLYMDAIRKHFELLFRNMNEMFGGKSPAFEIEGPISLKKWLIDELTFHIRANG